MPMYTNYPPTVYNEGKSTHWKVYQLSRQYILKIKLVILFMGESLLLTFVFQSSEIS